ncbi:hypothetical protein CJ255_13620 [Candidatus Viridilinea mediisalina]|uniref:DUF4145 domain-containing protein n=2 Tax=Candidatus Viridilinea mediisalina TaxID=2024553 RepID=A0A2A6RI04_9CHLR|nr:hypothetical protein CJ255_13620 [Candidatus Viridilinea mediisalina]
MLGTGNQKYNPHAVMQILLELSTAHLLRSSGTQQIHFVAYESHQAQQLTEAMDEHLGRVKVLLPKGDLVDSIKYDIDGLIRMLQQMNPIKVLDDLQQLILNDNATPLGFGITGRDLADAIVNDLLNLEDQKGDLNGKIRKLQKPKYDVPEWAKQYLHVLRTIGNNFAHGQAAAQKMSTSLGPQDLEIQLICIRRVLKLWFDIQREKSS